MTTRENRDSKKGDFVHWVHCRGEEGFWADREWGSKLDQDQIRCEECKGFRADRYSDAIRQIDRIALWYEPSKLTVIGGLSNLGGLVLHRKMIEVLDMERILGLCLSYPVLLDGKELSDYSYFVEKQQRGGFRGSKDSNIRLCSECGRLLYWPMPGNQWHLLRAYWDGSNDFTILDSDLLASPYFFDKVLKDMPRVRSEKRIMRDEPLDGLPVPYNDLVKAVGHRQTEHGNDVANSLS